MFRRGGRGGCGSGLRRRTGGEVTPGGGPGVIDDKSLTIFFLPIATTHPPPHHSFPKPPKSRKIPRLHGARSQPEGSLLVTSWVARQTAARLLRAQPVGGAPGGPRASLATRAGCIQREWDRDPEEGRNSERGGQDPDGKGIRKRVGKNSNRQEETETKTESNHQCLHLKP